MSERLRRAQLLIEQERFDLAENELHAALAIEPNDPTAHALMAIVLLEQERFDQATNAAQQAVHLAPEEPFSHYVLGRVYLDRNRFHEAMEAADQTIQLDPYFSQGFALKSSVAFQQKKWQEALDAANQGLAVSPDDTTCENLRVNALRQLGRNEEASKSAETLLEKSPDDAFSHCSVGFTAMTKGDHQKAREHFRQALMLDPNLELARQGMAMALRNRNPLYRVIFKYYEWMGRLSSFGQWGVILGGYFGYRVVSGLAEANPDLQLFLYPLMFLYFGFVLMTWIANPLFNVLLRFDRDGRYLLDRHDVVASNIVAILLGLGFVSALLGFVLLVVNAFGGIEAVCLAAYCLLMVIPVSGTANASPGRNQSVLLAITFGAAGVGAIGLLASLAGIYLLAAVCLICFLLVVMAFQFIANILATIVQRR